MSDTSPHLIGFNNTRPFKCAICKRRVEKGKLGRKVMIMTRTGHIYDSKQYICYSKECKEQVFTPYWYAKFKRTPKFIGIDVAEAL